MRAVEVYEGSDGALTRAFYAALEARGPAGVVAVNLFRAQKTSTRAKLYRGGIRGKGSYKSMAYDTKRWAMENLVKVLTEHGAALGITFGWKEDPQTVFGEEASWVLYVDLPQGQVSFHSPNKLAGPLYARDWDQQKLSAQRVIEFADSVASTNPPPTIAAPTKSSTATETGSGQSE